MATEETKVSFNANSSEPLECIVPELNLERSTVVAKEENCSEISYAYYEEMTVDANIRITDSESESTSSLPKNEILTQKERIYSEECNMSLDNGDNIQADAEILNVTEEAAVKAKIPQTVNKDFYKSDSQKLDEYQNAVKLEQGISFTSKVDQQDVEESQTFQPHISIEDNETEYEMKSKLSHALLSDRQYSSSTDSTENLSLPEITNDETEVSEAKNCDSQSLRSEDILLANSPYQCSEDESDNLLSELESELEYGDSENAVSILAPNGMSTDSVELSVQGTTKQLGKIRKTDNRRSNVLKFHNNEEGPTVDYYEVQMEFLERCNRKLQNEVSDLKSKLSFQEAEFKKKEIQIKAEMGIKMEKMSKQCNSSRKDKEAMVVRYAKSEKEVILAKKAQEELEKKLKDGNKEREKLISKLKGLAAERSRVCNNLDNKMVELATLQREHEKLKEDLNARDIRIKWAQNKLKTEMDSHKDTQGKLEHTLHRLQETREEAEQVRHDCQEMIRRYQEAEEIKSVSLDHQLKQKLSELEVQKQERSDQEEVYQLLRQELEALKKKQRITIEENNSLTLKIHSLEKERLEYEQTLSKLKDNQNSFKQEVVDLTARLAEMENLSMQLEREKEKLAASLREVERLRQTNAELQADMEACHMKEGELLEFTERLTAKTVHLQSEHSLLEAKAQTLEEELTRMNKRYLELEQRNSDLTTELEDEQKQRQEETQLLARKLAEKAKAVEQLNIKLEEADNENRVMKRRHITSIKELARELQQCRKKLEVLESKHSAPGESTSLGSRASSSGSLDAMANNNQMVNGSTSASGPQISPPVTFSGGKTSVSVQCKNSSQNSPPQTVAPNEVDKQMLIERIVRLQKILARKNDKIEFLEEHIGQLITEMKKKSKIIQNYILREETGALVPSSSDQNKLELSKRGGIMASVYSSQLSDSNMSLELSLEINHKLQAVLEDTLLKNITLKENINTLGEEIARLTTEQRELHNQLLRHKNVK